MTLPERMKFGIFLAPFHPLGENPTLSLERDLEPEHPIIGNVRGLGLLACVKIVQDRDTKERFPDKMKVLERLGEKFRERRLILRPRGTIVLAPPLCVRRDEIDRIVNAIDQVLSEMERELA